MTLAIMVGLLLVLASVFALGFMADFLSRPVLTGFLNGVGLQVAMHALTDLFGVQGHFNGLIAGVEAVPDRLGNANFAAIGIAGATVFALIAGKRLSSRRRLKPPVAMIVVVAAILLSWALDLGRHVPVVGYIPTGLPRLALPGVDHRLSLVWDLLPTAFAMAVVVLAQSAASARAYATRNGEKLDETRDLFALGLSNLGAGLSGTFVVNGSPTKTAMVASAGGRTQLSLLVTVAVVVLTLLFLTAPLSYLPQAVLSGVVVLIGLSLIDLRGLTDIYRTRRAEFWVALSTIGAVVAIGVEKGLGFAVVLSIISHTRHGYRPKDMTLAEDAGGHLYGAPYKSAMQIRPGLMVYRFSHAMYFANAQKMRSEISELVRAAEPPLQCFCIDISAVDDIDYTAQAVLNKIERDLATRSIRLVFMSNISEPGALCRKQLIAQFGLDACFGSASDLLARFDP